MAVSAPSSGLADGALAAYLEGKLDVFDSADKDPRHRRNLADQTFVIVESPTNEPPVLQWMFANLPLTVQNIHPDAHVVVDV